jgi:hypothetical protein
VHEISAPIEKRGDHNILGTAVEGTRAAEDPRARCTNPRVWAMRPIRGKIAQLAKHDPRPSRAA